MRYLNLLPFLLACNSGEVLDPELISLAVDPDVAELGQEVTSTVVVKNFTLAGEVGHSHDEGEDHDEDHKDGEIQTGHVHIYLDDLETNPLAMQVEAVGTFIVPEDAEIGEHVLIGRLHDSDHLIIEPQITVEIEFDIIEVSGR